MIQHIFYNGKVHTMDDQRTVASAVAVSGDRIAAVGDDDSILAMAGEGTVITDLKGQCMVPGFNDSHCHLMATGLGQVHLDLRGVTSCQEIVRRGRAYIEENHIPPGQWVIGYGFDNNLFDDPALPDIHVAEAISTEHPVFLDRVCGHVGTVNQPVLDLAGYTDDTQVTGGVLDKDSQGHLNGILREAALDYIRRIIPVPEPEMLERSARAAMSLANSFGVTSMQTDDLESADLDSVLKTYDALKKKDQMTVRVFEEVQRPRVPQLKAFLKRGMTTGWGDVYFKIGNIKILTDGSLGARTAYLSRDYADDPGNRGVAVYTQDALNEVVALGHKEGMQMAFHAIGDGAVEQCVTAVEYAQRLYPEKDLRHRIVHCQIADKALLRRVADAGMGADIQPAFTASDAPLVGSRLGAAHEMDSYRWKTMAEFGIPMGGGSDSPVETLDPLWGIYCAVTRQDAQGWPEGGWNPQERLTVDQAVYLYTRGGAYQSFEENIKGMIAPGYLADLAVLSQDIFTIPPEEIPKVHAVMTLIGGKICYVLNQS